jgi:hypothetical protein
MKSRLFAAILGLAVGTSLVRAGHHNGAGQIPSSDGRKTIPFELFRGHLILDAEINGQTLHLALDNGVLWDELLLYGGPKIDALNLDYDFQAPSLGEEVATPTNKKASGFTLRIKGVELRNQAAVVTPADPRLSKAFQGEDGVISGSLFNNFVVQLDFERMTMTLVKPERFKYTGKGQELALMPFGVGSFTLPCGLKVPGKESIHLNPVLDLGGLQPLLVFLGSREDITVPGGATPAQLAVGWSGFLSRVPELQIGRFTLKNVVTGFTEAQAKIGKECEALLGPGVFARFLVTFDYRNRRVFLEPNSHFHDEFHSRFRGWSTRPERQGD